MIKMKIMSVVILITSLFYINLAHAANASDGKEWKLVNAFWNFTNYSRDAGTSGSYDSLAKKVCELSAVAYPASLGLPPRTDAYVHSGRYLPGDAIRVDYYFFGCIITTNGSGWGTGSSYYALAKVAEPAEPEKKYTIKLSPVTAEAYGNYLTAIEPDEITRSKVPQNLINEVNLVAEVKDQDGNRVNAAIKLKVTAIDGSGGHDQESHTERNPSQAGKLKFDSLNSHTIDMPKSDMIDGIVEFVYAASEVSGDHKIEATCTDITCKQIGKDSVWVGIKNLKQLPASSNYTFTGGSCHHQNNHYATDRVVEKIQGIGRDYRSQFPNSPFLVFNDISLERGGLFDAKNESVCSPTVIKADWTATHNLHRTGEDVDVQANNTATAVPEANYEAFKDRAIENGCFADIHKPGTTAQHFHLYCTQKQGR